MPYRDEHPYSCLEIWSSRKHKRTKEGHARIAVCTHRYERHYDDGNSRTRVVFDLWSDGEVNSHDWDLESMMNMCPHRVTFSSKPEEEEERK